MDHKKYLISQIRMCRRKMNTAKLIDCGILFAAAGGLIGTMCELFSLIWQFYYVHLAAGLCFAAGLLAGLCFAVWKRADMRQAALRLDSFGLKERMITAYEHLDDEHEFAQMQKQDTVDSYEKIKEKVKISILPDKRHVLALILSAAMAAGLAFVPSSVREQAGVQHQIQKQAKEEKETLEEFLNSLEEVDMDSLTPEQKERLEELARTMEQSMEELQNVDSWESLASAAQRLDYKYEQAAQSLEGLAGQMTDPAMAGIANAAAFAKAAANGTGTQSASTGTPNGNTGDGSAGSGDGNGSAGDGNGNTENGDGGSGSGDGSGSGSGDGNGSGDGSGSGSGDGSGNGDGDGSGDGSGSGSGSGNSSGNGSGRGTGSSDASHDYVSIPNAVADDSSLTGDKQGDEGSEYYRKQNGLAWEGEHVDYGSVIGEYTNSAYEGISNGRYPAGMETVIRDYFENLNK